LFPERQDYRYFVSRRTEGVPPDFTDVVMPYSGMVILRDSWAADSQWAFFESAPFGRGHQHEDKLNFLLYAYGRDLLRDTGNFAYDSSDMRKYVLSSRAHNTVLVDGMGQNRRSRYHWEAEDRTKPADLSVKLGAERDVARGIYAEGYGPDNLDVRHERTVMKVKRNPLGLKTFYLVIDRLTAADGLPHVYDAHWQLEDVPVLTGGASGSPYSHHERGNYLAELLHGSRVTADYGDGVTLTLLSGENCTLRRGSRKPFVGWRTPNRPATAVDFTAVAPSARIVTLLYPSDEGCPIETVTYDSSVEDKEITIRTANGEWLFSE
ncbi:MAG: heparinase II/III-family protein, partial [Clostridia bacterium]|nr:heparinase II/III-family protein [Clostridia bacterium]